MADYAIHDTTLTDISNVIRKKEGSSALIDPADYAGRINLMGMLEEKTIVSSPIADFSDGSDDVPTKSVVVTIPPTLTGVSQVVETQINSDNLFLLPSNDFSVSGVDFKIGSDSLTIDGTSTANISSKDSNFKTYFSFGLPKGTYYFTRGTWTKATYVYKLADDSTALVTNSGSFTLTDYTEIYIGFYIGTGQTVSEVTFNGYLKQGSSASSYSPPTQPTQYTANLGRTIYGGQPDIVNGTGTENYAYIDLSQVSWTNFTLSGNRLYINTAYPNIKAPASNSDMPECICNAFPTISRATMGYSAPFTKGITIDRDGLLIIANPDDTTWTSKETAIASLAQMDAVCVIPLATPTDFTFDGQEIPTILGYNAFWSDEGDTSVAYRASGTIYNYPRGEEASF